MCGVYITPTTSVQKLLYKMSEEAEEAPSELDAKPKNTQSRKWVLTLWLHNTHICLEERMRDLVTTGRVRFIAFGEEVCPRSEALHYQAYVVGYNNITFKQLGKWFGPEHFFQPMYGTLRQNEDYCSKEGTFVKLGDEPKQGERNDIIGFKKIIEDNPHTPPVKLAREDLKFSHYVKYHNGLEKYHHDIRSESIRMDRTRPKVYIRCGDTGSGKTKWLDDTFGLLEWARMPAPTSNWWITSTVSYSDTVLVDDVGPTKIPKIEEFLEWTDRYPVEFNTKGGFAWWKPKNIVFTSNYCWTDWWPNMNSEHPSYHAIYRRIFRIDLVYTHSPIERFYPNNEEHLDAVQPQA